ncbi:MAG TPA: Ig domain-containing protein [Opitutaceae bacterium]|nr:Ig domain-containing protein [Opitutaceae bacterium]
MHTKRRWGAFVFASAVLVNWALGIPPTLTTGDWPGKVFTAGPPQPQPVVEGYPFSYFPGVNGATSVSATGLPSGLSIEPTYGHISGTPTASGSFPITLSATNADGTTSVNLTLDVAAPPSAPPVIIHPVDRSSVYVGTGSPTLASDEKVYSGIYFMCNGSNYPRKYTATNLPGGAELDQAGLIAYSPNFLTPGKYHVTVTATNDIGSDSTTFEWDVHPALVSLTADKTAYAYGDIITFTATFSGPVVVTGTPYVPLDSGARQAAYVSGSGTKTLTFQYQTSAADGTFTENVSDHIEANGGTILSPDGLSAPLTTAPSGKWQAPYTVSGSTSAAPVMQPIPDRDTTINLSHSDFHEFGASATNSPTSWSAVGVPPGVQFLTNDGTFGWSDSDLSGGEYNVTVTAMNASGSGSATFRWVIHPTLRDFIRTDKTSYSPGETITFTATFTCPVVVTGSPYLSFGGSAKAMYASGSGTNQLTFTYAIPANAPTAKNNSIYNITLGDGTIGTAGGTSATLGVPDATGINPPTFDIVAGASTGPSISAQTVNATVGTPVSAQIEATGAVAYQVTAGAMPPGLNLDPSTGAISGTPTVAGTSTVTVQVTDNTGATASANVTFAIADDPPPTTPPSTTPPSTKTDQTLTFVSPTSGVIVGQPIQLGAISSAGLPITYSVVSGDATINGSTLTPLSTAPLIVRASAAGNDTYNPTTNDVNFGSPQTAQQSIQVGSIGGDVTANTPVALAASSRSGMPVTYTVVSGPATISGNTLTFTGTGTVTVRVSQSGSNTVSAASDATVTFTAHPIPRLVDVSSRLHLTAGGTVTIGFVVTGTAPKPILIRAVGDGLGAFGVTDHVTKPRLTLFDSNSAQIATNAGWAGSADIAAADTATGAFALNPNDTDAAVLATLAPGAYTAQVTAAGAGTVLLEAYDVDAHEAVPTKQLINVSTRAYVDGANSIVQGFVVAGDQPKRVLIRAVGASLSQYGVTDAIADASLQVYSGSTVIAQNDDWGTPQTVVPTQPAANASDIAAAASSVGAFALPSGSKDAAALLTLPPGAYTIVVSGSAAQSGEVLVETYEVATAANPQ